MGERVATELPGIVLFAALGGFFLQKALRRRAARTWGWGRSGEAAPLSRPSYAAWGITFLVIAALVARAPHASASWLVLLSACLLALGIAGARDVREQRRRGHSR